MDEDESRLELNSGKHLLSSLGLLGGGWGVHDIDTGMVCHVVVCYLCGSDPRGDCHYVWVVFDNISHSNWASYARLCRFILLLF